MSSRQEMMVNTLSCRLKAAQREIAALRSGDASASLRREYEAVVREKDRTIERLRRERDEFSFSRRQITRQWQEVLEDLQAELEKDIRRLEKLVRKLLADTVRLEKRNRELEAKRKELLHRYYETAGRLEETEGMVRKLQAQVNHNYENSSLPSSKCIDRKKITNNREKTGKKPGAQKGHPHHARKPLAPDVVVEIPPEERFLDTARYRRTGKDAVRQVVGLAVVPVVTEYRTAQYYDKKRGRAAHSAFPPGVEDDVNYGGTVKAFLFLMNSRCNVSLEKTSRFLSELTEGKLCPSVGMINGLCGEFSRKTKQEQDLLFTSLLDGPVMHVDGTVARVNGENRNVLVCSNGKATMYFAREKKGDEGVRGTPVEEYGGILVHDHESCFFHYGSGHQDCLVHIERRLRDSMENEPGLKWNRRMLELIQEMIHERNQRGEGGIGEEKAAEFESRYDAVLERAGKEYQDDPPTKYYPDGYNLYRQLIKSRESHLLFLHNPLVPPDNNLCERKASVLKGKINQAVSLRSFGNLKEYCDSLSVVDHFSGREGCSLYQATAEVFERPKPPGKRKVSAEASEPDQAEGLG